MDLETMSNLVFSNQFRQNHYIGEVKESCLMTLEEAVKKVIESNKFKAACNIEGSEGSAMRRYKARYDNNNLTPTQSVNLLKKFGFEVKRQVSYDIIAPVNFK